MSLAFGLTVAAMCFALMLVGGGFYEVLVVDPAGRSVLISFSRTVAEYRAGDSGYRFIVFLNSR